MTRIVTVSFRNEDEDLWNYIEDAFGKPVNGTKIRDMLHSYKESHTTTKDARAQ